MTDLKFMKNLSYDDRKLAKESLADLANEYMEEDSTRKAQLKGLFSVLAYSAGLGALLGIFKGHKELADNVFEGARQAVISTTPFILLALAKDYSEQGDTIKFEKRIENKIDISERPYLSMIVSPALGGLFYWGSAHLLNWTFNTNLDPNFCTQYGVICGALSAGMLMHQGSKYRNKLLKRIEKKKLNGKSEIPLCSL